jgi:outer membrane lipoprotein-sorting protein
MHSLSLSKKNALASFVASIGPLYRRKPFSRRALVDIAPIRRIWFFAIFWSVPWSGHADESLASVMARMTPHGVVQFSYQETRTMELLAEPWHGNGVLYANPPDRMVKLQVQPARIVMVVDGDRMWYYDSGRQVRYDAPIRKDDERSVLIIVMQTLLNGDLVRLEQDFRIEFSASADSWLLKLSPKSVQAPGEGAFVLAGGPVGGVANRIVMQQADGDRSELLLTKIADHERLAATIDLLIEEAEGR